ncbi:MAG: class II glutamine amidotransferase [bacterium]|nr:class II glutamine amidotransferase [bacterium]
MCRLLGAISNKSVDLDFSLNRFEKYSKDNPDGWGLGWYENEKGEVFKQALSADDKDSEYSELSKQVFSKIIIAHIRKATEGKPSEQNSHPFKYDNWIFAHNGGVDREHLLPLLNKKFRHALNGETDSEVFFYWLLQCIEKSNNVHDGVKRAVEKIKPEIIFSGLNFLLSDGESLYSFRYSDMARNYYTLYSLKREPALPHPISFESKETKVMLHSKSLRGESAVLLCSEKLTDEDWKEVKFGNMLIIGSDLKMKEVKII